MNELITRIEFDTRNPDEVGTAGNYIFSVSTNQVVIELNGEKEIWTQIDNGSENLSGAWQITAQKRGEHVVPIHQTGSRKTVKILTGTRFQWTAIDPETKEFFGTGGGVYTFINGNYTETIEFFPKDNSRVGSSLSFVGEIKNGEWHHSGYSSKGDRIYEIWNRKK